MVDRCDESSCVDFGLDENETRETRRVNRLQVEEVSSKPYQKTTEGERLKAVEELVEKIFDQHQLPVSAHSTSNPTDCPSDCQTAAGTQTPGYKDYVTDDHGEAPDATDVDFLTGRLQEGDDESVENKTDTERQAEQERSDSPASHPDPPIAEEMSYHSVLYQMQQKRKRGRRLEEKTLMKMARMFVVAKGLDSKAMENSEAKFSGGPLAECEASEKTEEPFASISSPQNEAPSHDRDNEPALWTFSDLHETNGDRTDNKQNLLPQTLTDDSDVMQQDGNEDFLMSRTEEEVMCRTTGQGDTTGVKSIRDRKKPGRSFKKKTKSELFTQETEKTGDVSAQTSAEAVAVTPERFEKSEDSARASLALPAGDVASSQTEKQNGAEQIPETKTEPPKKARSKRTSSSTAQCKRGRRAARMLSTEEQRQNQTVLENEARNTTQLRRGADLKECKAEAVTGPPSVSFNSAQKTCTPSDIKTERSCEPKTQTSRKRKSSNAIRRPKTAAKKAKKTGILNVSVKQERDYVDVQRQEQQPEEKTSAVDDYETPLKSKRRRKKKTVEDGEQTMTPGCNVKCGTINQPPLTPSDIRNESEETSTPRRTHGKRKVQRKNACNCMTLSAAASLCGKGRQEVRDKAENVENVGLFTGGNTMDTDCKSLKQRGRRRKTNREHENLNTLFENLEKPRDEGDTRKCTSTSSGTRSEDSLVSYLKGLKGSRRSKNRRLMKKEPEKNTTSDEALNVHSNLIVISSSTDNASKIKDEAPDPEKVTRFKRKKKGLVLKRRPEAETLLEEKAELPDDVQSVVLNNPVPENVKKKGENLDGVISLRPNTQDGVEDKKRWKRGEKDLRPVGNYKGGELGDDIPAVKETTGCLKGRRQGRRGSKRETSVLSEDTQRVGNMGSDSKNGLIESFETPAEDMASKGNIWNEAKALNQKCSQMERDTGDRFNLGEESKIRHKGSKRKIPTKCGRASETVRMEESSLECSSSIHEKTLSSMDLNGFKREMSEVTAAFQDEIGPVHSAVPAGKTNNATTRRRCRRSETEMAAGFKKFKQPGISSPSANLPQVDPHLSASPSESNHSPCNSISGDLKPKDENDSVRDTNKAPGKSSDRGKTGNFPFQKPRPLECSFCGRSFRHISAFTVHRRLHTGEKPYSCTTCGKRFNTLSRLNAHSDVHGEPRAVRCPCCGGRFKSKDQLIAHFHIHVKDIQSVKERRTDGRLESSPLRCPVCCKEFFSRATFKIHRRTHAKEPRVCSVCGKKFSKPSSLDAHEKTHWPVKPYSCSLCFQGFSKLRELKIHSQMHSGSAAFTCAKCESAFGSFQSLRSHQMSHLCSEKQDANAANIGRFLAVHAGQIATPLCFKCSICKQLLRHWCQYVLHLQTHTNGRLGVCETCGQQYGQAAEETSHCTVCCRESGEERACASSRSEVWKEPEAPEGKTSGEKEVTPMQSPSISSVSFNNHLDALSAAHPSKFRPLIRRHRGKYSRPFSCARRDLQFRFPGSYVAHLRERAARTPHACPLCLETFADDKNTSARVCGGHTQDDALNCSTCGKNFSSLRNLKKHKVLHKGASAHVCLQRNLTFSTRGALKTHLNARRGRLGVPQPAGVAEPFLFSYHCGKCAAKFSSADLLQAHQICHFTAGKKPESVASSLENTHGVITELSREKRRLPVSNKKYLFRYPHPDRLYVVPVVSSEPPVVVSDTEEEQRGGVTTSADNAHPSGDPERSPCSSRPNTSNIPQSVAPVPLRDTDERETGGSTRRHAAKPRVRTESHQNDQDAWEDLSDMSDSETLLMVPDESDVVDEPHLCAVCLETFTDIQKLHEHYINHANKM